MSKSIGEVLETKAVKPIIYFAEFATNQSTGPLPKDLASGLDGLLLSHLVRTDDGSSRVITYWATVEHFEAGRQTLTDRLPAIFPSQHGPVVSVAMPRKPWWKRINPLTVVLSIAALVGALDAIAIHYDWLLARPLLVVKPEKSKVDLIEASDLRLTVALVNQLPRTEHRNIKVAAVLVDAGKKEFPLKLVEHDIAALAAGTSKDLIIEGAAPPAGEYALHVNATADAGWLRSTRTFDGDARVVVWPKTPRGSIRVVEAKPGWARLLGTVSVGLAAEQGLDCEMQVQGVPNLRFENQFRTSVGSRNLRWRQAGQSENAISVLTWTTGAVTSMQTITTEVILNREQPTDWKALGETVKLNCSSRQERVNEKS
jgi:hypothetical protein